MSKENIIINKNSVIRIQSNIIRMDDLTIPLSAITQIWNGTVPYKYPSPISALFLFFIALAGPGMISILVLLSILAASLLFYAFHYYRHKNIRGMNIRLNTGETYSFITDDEEFSGKVLNLISSILAENKPDSIYHVRFQGSGDIIDINKIAGEMQPEEMTDDQNDSAQANESDDSGKPLVIELTKLYSYYAEQDDVSTEILKLIESTIQSAMADDKEKMNINFEKFILSGLMKGCNELSLNLLINEIMSSLYQETK